jgi:general secretion pathway protein F
MTTYRYSAYTPTGRVEVGTIDAASRSDVLGALAKRGLTAFEALPAEAQGQRSGSRVVLKPRDLAHFSRELATLMEAELPTDEALRIIAGGGLGSKSERLAGQLLEGVVSGQAIANGLERHAAGAPVWLTSLVRAGEARGALGATFNDVARLLETRVETEEKIRSALIYPTMLGVIALGTLVIVVTVLFPALLQLFEDSGTEPPFLLASIRDIRKLLMAHGLLIGCGLTAVGGVAWLTGRRMRRRQSAAILDQLPVVGPIRGKIAVAVVMRTLGTLLANGVPLTEALTMAAAASPGRKLAGAMTAARQAVIEGERLAVSLRKTGSLPEAALRLAAIGEETGRLDVMLLRAAHIYERESERAVDRAMTLLSPIMTVFVGLLVGSLVLSIMQAILSVNNLAMR